MVAGAQPRPVAGLNAETACFDIHTTTFGGGEIRGFTAQVPASGTLALLALAFVGSTLRRHRAG
jgi:hypothetical protein